MLGVGYIGLEMPWLIGESLELITKVCVCAKNLITSFSGVNIMVKGTEASTVITAAATTIATLLVVIEMCTHAMGFHFDDINDAVRFVFKVIVYKIIIENSSKIVNLVYGLFMSSSAWGNVAEGFGTISDSISTAAVNVVTTYNNISDDTFLGIKKFFVSVIFLGVVVIFVMMVVKIIAQMAGLIFELCINVAIAPVPIATLVNSQTRSIGINFIKGFAGNCMTLTMYTLCFTVYGDLNSHITSTFGLLISETSDLYLVSKILPCVVGLVLLSVAIKNVSTMISKVLS